MASRRGAARELVLRYVADAREFLRPTEDAADATDRLADSTEKLTREQRKAEREAESVRRALDRLDRTADDASKSVGAKGRFGSIGAEAGDEFTENFGESVRGGDPLGALVETATSLGPALGAIGVGIAAGFGVIKAAWDRQKEAQQQSNDATELYLELLTEAGGVIDENARKELRAAAILALGNGSRLEGEREMNRLIAEGVGTREELLRIMTGELTQADKERLARARELDAAEKSASARPGSSDAKAARKDAIDDARTLLDLKQRGANADEAAAIQAGIYRDTLLEIQRRGTIAPGIIRAELAESRYRP